MAEDRYTSDPSTSGVKRMLGHLTPEKLSGLLSAKVDWTAQHGSLQTRHTTHGNGSDTTSEIFLGAMGEVAHWWARVSEGGLLVVVQGPISLKEAGRPTQIETGTIVSLFTRQ